MEQRKLHSVTQLVRLPAGVSSGVESAPGMKDFDKVTQFIANAREAFEELQ